MAESIGFSIPTVVPQRPSTESSFSYYSKSLRASACSGDASWLSSSLLIRQTVWFLSETVRASAIFATIWRISCQLECVCR